MPEIVGECVDRLITVEMRPPYIFCRGTIASLYESSREKLGVKSLTLLAAKKILESVKENDNVFIMSGFSWLPGMPHGETDGPLGVASIARALSLGLNAKPLLIQGEREAPCAKVTVKAAGLNVEKYEIVKEGKNSAAIILFPHCKDDDGKKFAVDLIDTYNPKAIFSFETIGPNRKGIHHSGLGFRYHGENLYHLFDEASKRGILTIAGIDLGNELGSGNIEEEVRKIVPRTDVCLCPCQAGSACRVTADVTIPVATSNWAAYGISAMLGLLLKRSDILQDADTERRMLEACISAGGVEGISLRPIMVVDGISDKANQCVVNLLHEIINNGLKEGEWARDKDKF